MKKILKDVIYHTQRNNKNDPYVTCYSTSISTVIDCILKTIGLDKGALGCPLEMQLDDFIYNEIYSKETKKWIRKNVSKFGAWMLNVRPQTIAYVEEYIFNKFMNRYGYECKFKMNQTFFDYCKLIDETGLPQILHGYFKPETKVGGHVIVGVGYDIETIEASAGFLNPRITATLESFIVHDPYGDANTKYKKTDGKFLQYENNHWFHKNKTAMWITTINKIEV